MSPFLFVGIFLCGGAGAWCRFALSSLIAGTSRFSFSPATFIINVVGSFLLGVLTSLVAGCLTKALGADTATVFSLLLGIGLLGGFTTFSTALYEAVTRLRSKELGIGLFLLFCQPACAFIAALTGLLIVRC